MALLRSMALAAVALALTPAAPAQVREDHYFELRFSTEDGLPSNSIRALEFDADGQLWIGTLAGLTVFDGGEFTDVPLANEGSPLAHRVTALQFDADGALLIGSKSGVLLRYSHDAFELLLAGSSKSIRQIRTRTDGSIVTAGPDLLVLRDGTVKTIASSSSRTPAFGLEERDGVLYAAGPWGLWRLDGDEHELLDAAAFDSLFFAPDGDLYAGRDGLAVPVNNPSEAFDLDLPVVYASERINDRMTMLAGTNSTRLLFATPGAPVPFQLFPSKTASRPRAIAVRGSGSWIGSDREGLLYIERTPAFQFVDEAGDPYVYARSVFELGSTSAIVQPQNGTPALYTQLEPKALGVIEDLQFLGMDPKPIWGCTRLRDGTAWMASQAGVLRLEGETVHPTLCSTGPVRAVVETLEGEVWATEPESFFRVLPDGKRGRSLPGPSAAPTIVAGAREGFYYVGNDGVYHINTTAQGGPVERVLELSGAVEPRKLKIGPRGGLWLTTYGDGLFHIRGREVRQFTKASGLNCDYLGWINFFEHPDTRRISLLLNSNRGLVSLALDELEDESTTRLTSLQVLSAEESEGPSGARLACGTILLPTLGGLFGYSLDQESSAKQIPRPLIDAVVVNGEDRDTPDGVQSTEVFGRADFDIGFTAIAMPSSATAIFAYRLLNTRETGGSDVAWVDSFSARSVQYFNLPPGDYSFQVRARLPGTAWSAPQTVKIASIRPFLYQRPQAQIALVLGFLMMIVYSFARFMRAEGTSQELSSQVEQTKTLAAQSAQREARYARLLDSSHDGIVLIELNEQISFANDAVTRSFGFERGELLEKDASWLGITDTQSILEAAEGSGSGPLFTRNVQVTDKYGIPHESDIVAARTELDGKGCLLVVIRDLTADNLLLDRLDTSERRFQALFQGAPAALITFAPDLRLIDWNRSAEALLGSIDEGENQLSAAFEAGIQRSNFVDQVHQTTETRSETRAVHNTRGYSGETLRVNWTISPLTTDRGEVTVLMAVAKDLREEEQAQARLVDLQRRLAKAQESERSRIAREIHDDLSQRLAATTMHAATIRARLPKTSDDEVPLMLDGLHDDLVRLTSDIHALSRQLHPTVLDDLGLVRAVDSECTRQSSLTGAEVIFAGPGMKLGLPSDVALTFFRIAQESIRNAIKHGDPKSINVTLEFADHRLQLSVHDDGIGFEISDGRAESQSGLGLISMEERARLIGADLSIHSTPGEGTMVTLELMLEGGQAASDTP
ncbi:MAG: PAS domain S-box protein [Planctomycetota bacterium]|nr:PAS domain S-box protein [Planctomycetota bacterium]